MSSLGLGEMFEGDSADRCAGKFPLVSMGVRAECPACADTVLVLGVVGVGTVAQNPISVYSRVSNFCMGS